MCHELNILFTEIVNRSGVSLWAEGAKFSLPTRASVECIWCWINWQCKTNNNSCSGVSVKVSVNRRAFTCLQQALSMKRNFASRLHCLDKAVCLLALISGFHCNFDEVCALLRYYAASCGNFFKDVWGQHIGPIFKGQEVDFLTLENSYVWNRHFE
jgi:hypothetical protein